MTRNEQLATVIRLACNTEDRSNQEQRVLVDMAWVCDREHNRLTTTNRARQQPDWEPQDLVSLVIDTRGPFEDGDRYYEPKNWTKQWASWERDLKELARG